MTTTPLTAIRNPDGQIYLKEENPHHLFENQDEENLHEAVSNLRHRKFEAAHPPILALFKCTEGQRFEDGVDVELVDQFQGHKDWHTCQNITIEMAKENNWPIRQVYTLKSDKGGEKLTNEVLERYGFSKIPHYTVADSVTIDIGRNRYLSACCVGTPNEMLWLGYKTHIDKSPTDLICLHNFDYDGKLTIERLELILKALNRPQS